MDIDYVVRYQLHPLGSVSWESYLGQLSLDCRSIEAAYAPDVLLAAVWPQLAEWMVTDGVGVAVIGQNTATGLLAAYRVDRQIGEYVDGEQIVSHQFTLPSMETGRAPVPQPTPTSNGGSLAERLRRRAMKYGGSLPNTVAPD